MAPSATIASNARPEQGAVKKVVPAVAALEQEIEPECQLASLSRGPNPLTGVNYCPSQTRSRDVQCLASIKKKPLLMWTNSYY